MESFLVLTAIQRRDLTYLGFLADPCWFSATLINRLPGADNRLPYDTTAPPTPQLLLCSQRAQFQNAIPGTLGVLVLIMPCQPSATSDMQYRRSLGIVALTILLPATRACTMILPAKHARTL